MVVVAPAAIVTGVPPARSHCAPTHGGPPYTWSMKPCWVFVLAR